MTVPVALGVVGCGVIGRMHLQVATQSPQTQVVAVADVREQAAREAAEQFGVETVYTDAEALFADPRVEAVILALPTCHRLDLALGAFARGKHVLTEKPVAMDAGEVRALIRARGALTAGCCSSRFRFLPSAAAVGDLLAGGVLGDLRLLRCRGVVAAGEPPKATPPAWRLIRAQNGGGILMNWGCYDLDYLFGLTGWALQPEAVLAQAWTVPPLYEPHIAPGSDAETYVTALIRCRGGATIAYERGEYVAAQSEATCQIIGSKGSLAWKMIPERGKSVVWVEGSTEKGVTSHVIWQGDEDYAMVHAGPGPDFAAAIREGRQPRTSLEQALLLQKVTDAIYASAAQGAAVAID